MRADPLVSDGLREGDFRLACDRLALGKLDRMRFRHPLDHADDLARIAELVVVPDIEDDVVVALGLGRQPVDDPRAAAPHEVGRDDLRRFHVVDLLAQPGVQRRLPQEGVHLRSRDRTPQLEVQDRERDVGRRHADRRSREPPRQLRQGLRDRLRRPRLGDDHVEGGGAPSAIALVEVVDEVLVVRERVHRLDVPPLDPVRLVERREHRGDRVRRARGGRQDRVVLPDRVAVDPVDDVLDPARSGGREQDAGDALRAQVLPEPGLVAPAAGVVHDDRVVDPVGRVVDRCRVVGVDHADEGAVREDRLLLLVDLDRALERPVDGVAPQEARALAQVGVAALAHDDRPQPQAGADARVRDEDAGDEPPDPPEAVEDDVGRARRLRPHDLRELGAEEVGERLGLVLPAQRIEALRQPRDVDRDRTEAEAGQRLEDREGLRRIEHVVAREAGEAVGLEDVDRRAPDEPTAVDRRDDPALAIEPADEGDHPLGELLAGRPVDLLPLVRVHGAPSLSAGRVVSTPRIARLGKRHPCFLPIQRRKSCDSFACVMTTGSLTRREASCPRSASAQCAATRL